MIYPGDLLECQVNTPEFRQYCKLRDGGRFESAVELPAEIERFGRRFAIGDYLSKGAWHDHWPARMELMLAWSSDPACWRPGAVGSLLAKANGGQQRITMRDAGKSVNVPLRPEVLRKEDGEKQSVVIQALLSLTDEDERQSYETRLPAQCTLRPIDVRLAFDPDRLTQHLHYLAGSAQDKRNLLATTMVIHGFLTARSDGALCAVRRLAKALQGPDGRSTGEFPQSWKDTVGNAVLQAARAGALPEEAAASQVTDSTDGWRYFREHSAVFDRSACTELPSRADAPEALDAGASNEAKRNAAMYLGAKNDLIALLTEGWAITQAARIPVSPASRELHLEWLVAGVPDGENI